jgi:hypothetical protein
MDVTTTDLTQTKQDSVKHEIQQIMHTKTINVSDLVSDITTVIEYDHTSHILTSNNLILNCKGKELYIYCIVRGTSIKAIDAQYISKNNTIKRFKLLITHNQESPKIFIDDNVKIEINEINNT